MLDISKMISSAEESLGWPYVSPGTNDRNGIDCSGLFVKIYQDQGASIYHGSNKIFRKYCSETGRLNHASQLIPGMAVFKWQEGKVKGYKDDLGDFHHIGLVVSVNPLKIIHASSAAGEVTTDFKINKWAYWGKLKDVDYGSEKGVDIMNAIVFAESGSSVKMRGAPKTSSSFYIDVPIGSSVTVLEKGPEWSHISYGGKSGYMMSKFLKFEDDPTAISETAASDEMIPVRRAELEKAYDIIGDLLGLRG